MRKANQEITDPQTLETILQKATIIRLAMVDNGMPYLLPFNFGYSNNCIFIHSAPAGKKIEVLRQNPQVCFEVEDETATVEGDIACRWSTMYRSVIGYGKVEIVTGFDEKKQALDIIMQQHGAPANMEFDPKEVEFIVVLKLTIDSMTGKQSSNWNRLRERENDLLGISDNEAILVLSEVLDFGLEVFNNDKEKFHRWLKKPNLSLGGIAPESLFDSITGIQEVHNALNRLEYGNMA
jgi:uncharacterized protein